MPIRPPPAPPAALAAPSATAGRLRHLAQARRRCAPTAALRRAPCRAALLGASAAAAGLAAALGRAGTIVTVIEPDPDDAARLAAHLRRSAPRAVVSATPSAAAGSDLVLWTGGPTRPDADPAEDAARTAGAIAAVVAAAPDGAATAVLGEDALPPGRPGTVAVRLAVPGSGLVELMAASDTDPTALSRLAGMAAAVGCVPLIVPPGAEGAAAGLLAQWCRAAEALIFAGTVPWELDEAVEALGFALGPCALMDRIGLDAVVARAARLRVQGKAVAGPGVVARMLAEGRLGRQAGVGWYRYPGGGGRVVDPLVEDLVREEARFAGVRPEGRPPAAAAAALVAALEGEARRLATTGATAHRGDVAVAAMLALGAPLGLDLGLRPGDTIAGSLHR